MYNTRNNEVPSFHFYFYLQYTSDRQHGREYAQAGVSVGTVDRPGGGGGGVYCNKAVRGWG